MATRVPKVRLRNPRIAATTSIDGSRYFIPPIVSPRTNSPKGLQKRMTNVPPLQLDIVPEQNAHARYTRPAGMTSVDREHFIPQSCPDGGGRGAGVSSILVGRRGSGWRVDRRGAKCAIPPKAQRCSTSNNRSPRSLWSEQGESRHDIEDHQHRDKCECDDLHLPNCERGTHPLIVPRLDNCGNVQRSVGLGCRESTLSGRRSVRRRCDLAGRMVRKV